MTFLVLKIALKIKLYTVENYNSFNIFKLVFTKIIEAEIFSCFDFYIPIKLELWLWLVRENFED